MSVQTTMQKKVFNPLLLSTGADKAKPAGTRREELSLAEKQLCILQMNIKESRCKL